jgi:hypothetical protein
VIARVIRGDSGVLLEMQDGARVVLPVQSSTSPPLPPSPTLAPSCARTHEALHRRELLFSRIQDAIPSSDRAPPAVHLDVLDRKARRIGAWRDSLRVLVDRAGGYRGAHVLSEQLLEVVADVRASPERRIAAAVALSTSRDDECRLRIHAAAHTCADDELRAAMERAAEGELDDAGLARIGRRYRI